MTADETRGSLGGASRYSSAQLVYPSPYSAPLEFLDWAEATLAGGSFDLALPVTDATTDLLVRHKDRWPAVQLPFAEIAAIDALSDKVLLYQKALELGVQAPRSVVINKASDIDRAIASIGFPAILKPRRSKIWCGTYFHSTTVRRVEDERQLRELADADDFQFFPYLYQELVPGTGGGIFALYSGGDARAFFAHRRIREKPPDGGVSVVSESCAPDPRMMDSARRILDNVGWHGVAMIEFKVTADGEPYLIEVNARFWGSLQLAIDAGVNFPLMLLDERDDGGASIGANTDYRVGRRLRWFLGDVDRIYIVAKRFRRYGLRRLASEVVKFMTPHPMTTRHEVFRWTDPRPAFREYRQYLRDLASR